MDESWRDALGAEFSKPYMRKLQEFLSTEWPAAQHIPTAAAHFSVGDLPCTIPPKTSATFLILPFWNAKMGLPVLLAWENVNTISRRWQCLERDCTARFDGVLCCCRAFNSAPVDQVRVVVIGQVGYPFLHA